MSFSFQYNILVHNRVNKRLHGEITEDPKHPKIQFPSKYLCATCQSMSATKTMKKYNLSNTVNFLLEYYSKKNIDTSLVIEKYYGEENLLSRQERFLSEIEHSVEKKRSFSLLQLALNATQHFSFYIVVALSVILVLFRHRYLKPRKRLYGA